MTFDVKMTQEQRSAYKSAVTALPGWPAWRLAHGVTAATITKDQLHDAGRTLGLDPVTFLETYTMETRTPRAPKPRTVAYGPFAIEVLSPVILSMGTRDRDFVASVAEDAAKHAGMITEGQADALRKLAARYTEGAPRGEPVPAPAPAPVPAPRVEVEGDEDDEDVETLRRILARRRSASLDEDRVIALIREHSATPATVRVDLRAPGLPQRDPEERLMHYREPLLLAAVAAGVNIMLVGPAGSGKTTAAANVAKALNVAFDFTGAVSSEYKLSGFVDAQGRIVSTSFRRAYEGGGVFLFDEIDGSSAAALLAFNAAVANDFADFPDGKVMRHPDFRVVAAANTFGRGADRQYVGRSQLDAASLDRFAVLTWDYDSAVEAAMVGLPRPEGAPVPASIAPITEDVAVRSTVALWFDFVARTRRRVEEQKIRHVVSPRATVMGARLLVAGWPRSEVEEACVYKGLDADSRAKIIA